MRFPGRGRLFYSAVAAVLSGVALLVIANRPAWHVARNAITIAHEGGHAVISLLTGRKLAEGAPAAVMGDPEVQRVYLGLAA